MKSLYKLLPLLFIGLLVTGCTSASNDMPSSNDNLTVYTTIYPIQYIVEQIGGDSLTVKSVYPPGVDAHTYEPTSKDMTDIAESDAFIYLGAGMESFAQTAAGALEKQDVLLMEIGKHEELFQSSGSTEHDHEDEHEHHHGDQDPHIWIDPLRMIEMAAIIKDELITLNPDEETAYTDNFAALKEDLLQLDQQFTETLESKENKKILVSHAAFGYWEERYGIEQISVNGISSSSEPSQKELTEIIDQAKEYNLDYILFEQNSSNRVSEVIQNEIGAEVLTIHNLSVLTDEDIANNEDYLSLMTYNLEILDQATK
ncbi:metal ABC transporter solute-binding protein, Zn/Mn family [Oceanobacillus chungangensis]|uniref:Adhesin n=1 Tax=Oceanobacillus chungangensis TaxID=1229152 RepID=A0A3D8Q1N9_9BACI|nr:zinc ABC transporter substrate-binding protein [Oceanobacillus chungangensis]RDW20925.1 adhesin [Oceanobacillus chungangensis]